MKCELCKHQDAQGTLLCETCADMVRRLIAVDQRLSAREIRDAEPPVASPETLSTASGQGF